MGATDETTLKKTTCCEQLKKRVTDKYFKKKLGFEPYSSSATWNVYDD